MPIVGEQGWHILAKSVRQKERRTVGRQHLSDVVDEALRYGLPGAWQRHGVLATNGRLHEEALKRIAPAVVMS